MADMMRRWGVLHLMILEDAVGILARHGQEGVAMARDENSTASASTTRTIDFGLDLPASVIKLPSQVVSCATYHVPCLLPLHPSKTSLKNPVPVSVFDLTGRELRGRPSCLQGRQWMD